MRASRRLAGLVVPLCLFAVGCDDSAPSADTVRAALERQLPGADFDRDSHIRLGRFAMMLGRGILRIAGDDPEASRVVSNVRRLEVSSYRVEDLPELTGIRLPDALERRLEESGWQSLVRTRESDGLVWIFTRTAGDGSISNLYIVDLDPSELTVIDLRGRLDRITADAISDDPGGFVADVGP